MGALNIYDIMLAHNVSAYTATRKLRVLKVTFQVATPGAESAVCDCLVCDRGCVGFTEHQSEPVSGVQAANHAAARHAGQPVRLVDRQGRRQDQRNSRGGWPASRPSY